MLLKKAGFCAVSTPIFLTMLLFILSCGSQVKKPENSSNTVSLTARRFEVDLMKYGASDPAALQKKYPDFFELYFFQVIRIGTPDSNLMRQRIADFVSDPDIVTIGKDAGSKFTDFSRVDEQLTQAFRLYSHYFPGRVIPRTTTFISGFNNAIVCTDSLLGMGLDMYLGKDSKYYQALHFPAYKMAKMTGDYLAVDAMKGWLQTEWTEPENDADLISHMIYQGKILYALKKIMPAEPDSLLMGYSKNQLAWSINHEKNVWSFFIDNKLLFATEQNQIMKFVTDGPTTGGFPKESPGNIGQWIGYRIVDAYMQSGQEITLSTLMNENDYKKILRESGYKPGS